MHSIVVGYDASPGADQAVGLIPTLRLRSATVTRLVTAVPAARQLRSAWGRLIVGEASVLARELSSQAEAALGQARERLSNAGLTVETAVVTGRPSLALVEIGPPRPRDAGRRWIARAWCDQVVDSRLGIRGGRGPRAVPGPCGAVRNDPPHSVCHRRVTRGRGSAGVPCVAPDRATGARPSAQRRPGHPLLGGRDRTGLLRTGDCRAGRIRRASSRGTRGVRSIVRSTTREASDHGGHRGTTRRSGDGGQRCCGRCWGGPHRHRLARPDGPPAPGSGQCRSTRTARCARVGVGRSIRVSVGPAGDPRGPEGRATAD